MKHFLSIVLISSAFYSPAWAQDAGSDAYIPPPSQSSHLTLLQGNGQQAAQGNSLPWLQGGGGQQSQASSPPSSSSTGDASSSAQDIQSTTQNLSDTVQGTVQNVNDMRNSVRSLRNGGAPVGAGSGFSMGGLQQVNASQQYLQGLQGVNVNNLSPAQRSALLSSMRHNPQRGIGLQGAAGQQFIQRQPPNMTVNGMPPAQQQAMLGARQTFAANNPHAVAANPPGGLRPHNPPRPLPKLAAKPNPLLALKGVKGIPFLAPGR
jgi:hypothetical protein